MIYSIFPTKDATIFENSASMNTGIDEILEITKMISSSAAPVENKIYNSRVLMQFDISSVSQSIVNNIIKKNNLKFYLNMYISEASDLPYSYGLEMRPVSTSWEMGIGRNNHYPETTEGVSWTYTDGKSPGNTWYTSSTTPNENHWATGTTGSWSTTEALYKTTVGSTLGGGEAGEAVTIPGGGGWHVSSSNDYYASQTFTYESADVRADVTNIVKKWISGSVDSATGGIVNNGLIIKRSGSEERDNKERGSLKFFSRDTHTIYSPKLEICWDDTIFDTASLEPLDIMNKDIVVYMKHNNGSYKENSRTRFRVHGREKYPPKTYATKSAELTIKYLPSSSYYSIKDAHTEETIVPFDTKYTAISCDEDGNYFDLYMDGLQPERYYRFIYKITSGSRIEYYDKDYLFKVVR